MTSEQFKRLRKQYWKTQMSAAIDLGLTQGAIGHYESGLRPVPEVVRRLMYCLIEKMKNS